MPRIYLIYLLAFFFMGCQTEVKPLRIAVASSLYEDLNLKFIKEFKGENFNNEIELISGSSLKLSTQIVNGAPFDIFISADLESINQLRKKIKQKELTPPQKFGHGFLMRCDWNTEKEQCPKKVILANARLAPFGKLAENYLKSKHCKSETFEAPNAIGALQIFNLKEVNTVLTSASLKNKTSATCIELKDHHTDYYIELLNNESTAQKWFEFLLSRKEG